MFGNKKLKERIEKLENELTLVNSKIEVLWDVCEPQINDKIKESVKNIISGLSKIFDVENSNETLSAEIKEETIKPVENQKDTKRKSVLAHYYDDNKLNVELKQFEGCDFIGEKEVAALCYLFDQYKYIDEISKHIKLSKNTLNKYAYALARKNYIIYKNGMGRVANGCLIYNKGV